VYCTHLWIIANDPVDLTFDDGDVVARVDSTPKVHYGCLEAKRHLHIGQSKQVSCKHGCVTGNLIHAPNADNMCVRPVRHGIESQRLSLNKAKWWKTERHWLMQTFRAKVSCNEMTSLTRTAVVTFIVGCWLPYLQRMCFTHNARVTYDQGRRQGRYKEIYPPPKKKL